MVAGVNNVKVVVAPLPAIAPGLIVHAPAGNPLKATLPVGTVQVGCMMIPTTGAVIEQYVTELSVLELVLLVLPATSSITPGAIEGIIIPLPVADMVNIQFILSEVVLPETDWPVAVPPKVISVSVNVAGLIALLKTTSKETGTMLAGSGCATL